jgi:nucleoside-diphosphate-sugar epimerase
MNAVNVAGTELVLATAERLGLDPIVYVSSELALLPPARGEVLTPDSPTGRAPTPYCRSKAESEDVARKFQERGRAGGGRDAGGDLGPPGPALR